MNIPIKKIEVNRKEILVVPDYFVEEYLGLKKGDVAIKMSRPKYKEYEDYLIVQEYERLNYEKPSKEYIGLTLSGFNSYFTGLRAHNKTETRRLRADEIRKALRIRNPFNSWSLNIYDIIKDDNFEIDYIVDLLSDVIDISEQEILEIIDGKYKVKAEMCMRNVNGKATPSRLLYVSKDALKCILSELLNQERINKEELMYIMRKIIFVQSSVESCA